MIWSDAPWTVPLFVWKSTIAKFAKILSLISPNSDLCHVHSRPHNRPSRPVIPIHWQWYQSSPYFTNVWGSWCRGGSIQQLLSPSLPCCHHHQHRYFSLWHSLIARDMGLGNLSPFRFFSRHRSYWSSSSTTSHWRPSSLCITPSLKPTRPLYTRIQYRYYPYQCNLCLADNILEIHFGRCLGCHFLRNSPLELFCIYFHIGVMSFQYLL